MFTSLTTALSALSATSTAIDVVGNNLANLNTLGFKASEVSFHDLLTQSMGGSASGQTEVGFGVGSPTTQFDFSQGALQTTSGALDAAIQGNGFFVVQTSAGATQYSRAGNFQINSQGLLTTATGDNVQGWTVTNGVLNTNAPLGDISVPTNSSAAPVPTTSFSLNLNLNAAAALGSTDATFSTSLQVFDSLGNAHTVTATFTKDPTTTGQWDYSLSVPDADVSNPPASPLTGSITFDSNGNLVSPAATDPPPVFQVQGLADGASDLDLSWNLYNGTTPDLTQFAQASSVSAVSQNGSDGRAIGERRTNRRGHDRGAVFRRADGRCRATGDGHHPESAIADCRRQQRVWCQRPHVASRGGNTRNRGARFGDGRRCRVLERRYCDGIDQFDCVSELLSGERQSGDHGGHAQPSHHQPHTVSSGGRSVGSTG